MPGLVIFWWWHTPVAWYLPDWEEMEELLGLREYKKLDCYNRWAMMEQLWACREGLAESAPAPESKEKAK